MDTETEARMKERSLSRVHYLSLDPPRPVFDNLTLAPRDATNAYIVNGGPLIHRKLLCHFSPYYNELLPKQAAREVKSYSDSSQLLFAQGNEEATEEVKEQMKWMQNLLST